MASGDSFSRASVARPQEGGHSQAALHLGARMRAPMRRNSGFGDRRFRKTSPEHSTFPLDSGRVDSRGAHPEHGVAQAALAAVSLVLSRRRRDTQKREPPSSAAGVLPSARLHLLRSSPLSRARPIFLHCFQVQPVRPSSVHPRRPDQIRRLTRSVSPGNRPGTSGSRRTAQPFSFTARPRSLRPNIHSQRRPNSSPVRPDSHLGPAAQSTGNFFILQRSPSTFRTRWMLPNLDVRGKESGKRPWESRVCAPEFNLVGARMRAPKQTRLGSVHLPGDARRTHVRRSRHLPFYDPKVEGRQVTRV
ncbi:hypothetical protein CRG98_006814 [Punica granatum]|uniref:Uncharacterized protein n=1 Tax=Punica granatum TaxID=22663 RepID=A0A2I0KWD7_PUNGR|nr:hypothetical protein CRG98_006814 [Punica granatum]